MSRWQWLSQLAFRYSLSKKQSPLLAFITRLSVASIVLAVSLLITVLSVMNGFERALKDDILSIVPHITLSTSSPVSEWRDLKNSVEELPGVKSVNGFSMSLSMLSYQGQVKPLLLYGLDAYDKQAIQTYQRYLPDFDWHQLQGNTGIVLGSALANKMGLNVGDTVSILSADGQNLKSNNITVHNVIILALIHSGTELDQKLALADLSLLANIKTYPTDSVDGLRVQVEDIFSSRSIARNISQITGLYFFRDWSMSQGNLYHAVQMSKKLVVLLTFIIIAVAAFNVVSTLLLAVNEKKSDMAILQTMGASLGDIRLLFLMQGFIIGALGVLLGALLGVVLSLNIVHVATFIESILGFQLLDSAIYPVDALPSQLLFSDVILVCTMSFLLTVAATIAPAWVVSKHDPATVLSYE